MERKMKDSHCKWIGEIPSNWGITKIGHVYDTRNVKVSDLDYAPLSVTMNGVVPQLEFVVKSDDRNNRKLVRQGDFVINSRSDRRGSYGVAPTDGSCSLINIVLQPRSTDNIDYYNYVLHSEFFSDEFYRWGNGIVADLWTTRWESMKKIPLPNPDDAEKKRIVDFLDSKCKEIDVVLEKTIQTIENYKLYKKALITNVITNGLKQNCRLKNTNISWYGDIPADWNVIKLRRIFSIKKSIAGQEGHTVLSITQRGIVPKDIRKNEGQMASNYSNYQFLKKGEFAMNHMDLLTGWVDISEYNGVTSPDYRVFVLNDEECSNPRYYLYLLQMCYFNKIFYSLGQGVSEYGRWRLQADKFLDFEILAPSYDEQCEIANFLDNRITEIDSLISSKEKLIIELRAYKKLLIYEYTTGKKAVSTIDGEHRDIDYPYFPANFNAKSPRFAQAILMSKILDENCDNMGRVKLEKTLYTIENSIGFDFDTEYVRDVAGPFDSSIYDCEGIISRKNKWFVIDETGRGVSYNTTEKKDTYKKYYMKYFSEYDAEIQRIIDLFSNYTTNQAEIIATLFAAWNDAIIDKKAFTDENIVNDILDNWHDKKKRFSKDIWLNALGEMREINLVPKGYGKHTVKKGER